jgi:hypothetical protein
MADEKHIMNPEEAAQYLHKSLSWVYKNADMLGGRKLGGSLFFPAKEDLYEHIFCKGKGVEVRLHPKGNQVYGNLVQNKNRGQSIRGRKKKGVKEPQIGAEDPNRYGLFDIGKQEA